MYILYNYVYVYVYVYATGRCMRIVYVYMCRVYTRSLRRELTFFRSNAFAA